MCYGGCNGVCPCVAPGVWHGVRGVWHGVQGVCTTVSGSGKIHHGGMGSLGHTLQTDLPRDWALYRDVWRGVVRRC